MTYESPFDEHRKEAQEMGYLIEEHANGHRNSNSPYGHSCPSSCLASSILLWQERRAKEKLGVLADLLESSTPTAKK